MNLTPTLITPPAAALYTIDEVREHVRRDDQDDDAYLTLLIDVVTGRLDGINGVLGRALITQTWSESFDGFPVGSVLPLVLAPAISVSAITYYDTNGDAATLDAGSYRVFNAARQSYVKLNSSASWPSTDERDDAVTVQFVAGYGATAASVPAEIRHAGKLLLAHYYENREEVLVGTIATPLPNGVMTLLRRFIRPHF
jgi:uncharacterized phiE125 gp8 family phage protein